MTRKYARAPGNRNMVTTRPTYIQLLLDSGMPINSIADKIGVSRSLVFESLRDNEIRLAYDLAAKSILQDKTDPESFRVENKFQINNLSSLVQIIKEYFQNKSILDLSPEEFIFLDNTIRETLMKKDAL